MLMCKIVLRGAWLSTFSRDAMRILCLSLAGRWWRAESETGEFDISVDNKCDTLALKQVLLFWSCNLQISTSAPLKDWWERNISKLLEFHGR